MKSVDNKLQILRIDRLDDLLDHMVAVLVFDALEHMAIELLG